jgi:hypothetical protein
MGTNWIIMDEDKRSLGLIVDLTKVQLETMLRDRETRVRSKEHVKRLKEAGLIRLDAKVFQTLWENQDLIPEAWKKRINGNIRYIRFTGTEIRGPGDYPYVFCLRWRGGQWDWRCLPLKDGWGVNAPSAVLASPV